tara:strand:- start:2728 stop:2877 length:150 start_codon:yes stop_codon:yes gene_type:complete
MTQVTYHSKKEHKASIRMIVSFYKSLLRKGIIKEGSSAYSRMIELKTKI